MVNIIIHRGTHTIGGSCIEVQSNNHRIIFDLGLPLMGRDGAELDENALRSPSIENGILPNIAGLYKHQKPSVDAVILSHPHIDHYGLADYIHPDIPVYVSKGVQILIEVGNIFYPKQTLLQNVKTFEHYKPFSVGPFKIISHLVDHSGFDASAFVIEAEGKKIFYTGDLRGHGRKGKLFDQLIDRPPKDSNCMLMEGTTLGGQHKAFKDETAIKQEFYNIFADQTDLSFVHASGSNVDRLVSLYKATKHCGKILVLDLYTFHLLNRLREYRETLPPFDGDHIRIYYIKSHADALAQHLGPQILYDYKYRKIGKESILENRQNIVLKLPVSRSLYSIAKMLAEEKPLTQAKFIYSMWSGYYEKNPSVKNFCAKYDLEMVKIHTGGHASLNDLMRLADATKPKTLIPIHTLAGDDFEKYFQNVLRLDDGIPFQIK